MKFVATVKFTALNSTRAAEVMRAMLSTAKDSGAHVDQAQLNPVKLTDKTVVYTDGGCDLKKQGVGAWAFMATLPDGKVIEDSGCWMHTTNNRMELMGIIKALEVLEIGQPIQIISDSQYCILGITQWVKGWIKHNWKKADGAPVLNKDLWLQLIALDEVHNVTYKHVKGHSGNKGNDHVDEVCTDRMQAGWAAIQSKGKLPSPPIDPGGKAQK